MQLKKRYIISSIIVVAIIFIVYFIIGKSGHPKSTEVSLDVAKQISDCDEKQKYINMAIIPDCYLKIFKDNNWSEMEVKNYLGIKNEKEFNEQMSESNSWEEAWLKYYPPEFKQIDETTFRAYKPGCGEYSFCQITCYDNSTIFFKKCAYTGNLYIIVANNKETSIICPSRGNLFHIENNYAEECIEDYIK